MCNMFQFFCFLIMMPPLKVNTGVWYNWAFQDGDEGKSHGLYSMQTKTCVKPNWSCVGCDNIVYFSSASISLCAQCTSIAWSNKKEMISPVSCHVPRLVMPRKPLYTHHVKTLHFILILRFPVLICLISVQSVQRVAQWRIFPVCTRIFKFKVLVTWMADSQGGQLQLWGGPAI